jgi:hypothetical protein
MNNLLLLFFLPSTVCFLIAGLLAYNSLDGWGWLIIAGVIVYPNVPAYRVITKSTGGKP